MYATGVILQLHDDSYNSYGENNIISLLSDQLRHMFDDLYQAWIMEKENLGSSTVDDIIVIMWSAW